MAKRVLLLGGTRFFGILLARRLIEAGHDVTVATRGRAPDPFGGAVRRITVDRRVRSGMQQAFARTGDYDVVYDQMCYSPLDAAISADVFTGRVGRYVMASTIEVYDPCRGQILRPLIEADVDLDREPIELDYPWHSESVPEERYGTGKRQAEVYFHRNTELPVVAVRIAHVLAGPEDFTRRLASYVDAVREGRACRYSQADGKSSFISALGIARFMEWVGAGEFLGPVNAASDGPLNARELYIQVARLLGRSPRIEPVSERVRPSDLSPFDYPDPYVMSTDRARSLGYRFDSTGDWLDRVIRQHILAGVA